MRIQRIEKDNAELLFAISDGDKKQIDAWKATDIFEFFTGLWVKEEINAEKLKALEAERTKQKIIQKKKRK